jgi:hypothetical protein
VASKADLAQRIAGDAAALGQRAAIAEANYALARAEIRHALSNLPFPDAKSGQTHKVRRRLARFLDDRLDGL